LDMMDRMGAGSIFFVRKMNASAVGITVVQHNAL